MAGQTNNMALWANTDFTRANGTKYVSHEYLDLAESYTPYYKIKQGIIWVSL